MKRNGRTFFVTTLLISVLIITGCATLGREELFVAEPLPVPLALSGGISAAGRAYAGEGLACDAEGNVYVTNFERQGTIGKIATDGTASVYLELPNGGIGSAIVFDKENFMYIVDSINNNILRVDPETQVVTVFIQFEVGDDVNLYSLNDLQITPVGTIYAFDSAFLVEKTINYNRNRILRIDYNGNMTVVAESKENRFVPNAISPDGKTIYSHGWREACVLTITITDSGDLTDIGDFKCLYQERNVSAGTINDITCDVDGNLYVSRSGNIKTKGPVVKISPDGEILGEYDIIQNPGKIVFGGPDGRTAYMIDNMNKSLVKFRVDRPGAEWQRLQP